ncbi:galactose-3-O-sulfotransferase 2-like [Larus michahellis]|uniref:galactose-3-O-sulfotransferase 2-like n=1 Tax=Larus michahellis TaxID=119627 RepID=UPI003D9B67B6
MEPGGVGEDELRAMQALSGSKSRTQEGKKRDKCQPQRAEQVDMRGQSRTSTAMGETKDLTTTTRSPAKAPAHHAEIQKVFDHARAHRSQLCTLARGVDAEQKHSSVQVFHTANPNPPPVGLARQVNSSSALLERWENWIKSPTRSVRQHHFILEQLLLPCLPCKPKTDIVFLKVHKSASSTVMNILFRFGEMHNLTFAFPIGGGNQLFYPRHFLARFVEGFSPSSPRRFNILCHHMRFLQPEVHKVVPSSAFYFSILRNPVKLMESSFAYYKGASAFSRVRSLEEFLRQPYHYYNPTDGDRHYARNLMTFDFGFNPDGEVSAERVKLMLKAIEASFDLLLISEYFDESMVLLKEMLCWDLDSVVSFPLNIRDSSTKSPLSDTVVEKIKEWNRLDWEIYTHFNRTFWERIDRDIGRERMQREVKALRERQGELARTCLQGMGSVAPKHIKDSSLKPLQHGSARILGYNLKQGLDKETERMCRRLVTPELQYSSALYKKQFAQNLPETQQPPQQGNAPQHRPEGTQN